MAQLQLWNTFSTLVLAVALALLILNILNYLLTY